jgi:hypothetical protein
MGVVRFVVILLRAFVIPRAALVVRTLALPVTRSVCPRTAQQFSGDA